MAKKLTFKVKNEQGTITDVEFVASNTWILRSQELLRHEHYLQMASMAKISPNLVACDIQPVQENGMMVCYRVSGPDINGMQHHSVGSAAPGNVKMQGAYYPEMAFKRAYDTWVKSALGLDDQNIGSQVGMMNVETDDITQPELALVDFGKHRGKTLGDIWKESPSWITDWLITDKFVPKNEAALFMKTAGIALAKKMQGGGNNTQPPVQQNNAQNNVQNYNTAPNNQQQQPPVQQNNAQNNVQNYNTAPNNQQQQPPVQQNNAQRLPQGDINALKAQLQSFWVSKGYDRNSAGIAINGYFKSNSIHWNHIILEQVQQLLANKDLVFVQFNSNFSQSNANAQQPVANNQGNYQQSNANAQQSNANTQQQVANNQGNYQQSNANAQQSNANAQQPVANNQGNNVMQNPVPNQPTTEQAFCDNANGHSQPQALKQSEINFSMQNSRVFNGKKYCMACVGTFKNGVTPKKF